VSEVYRVAVINPDATAYLVTNRDTKSPHYNTKYFTKDAAKSYVRTALRLLKDRNSEQEIKVLKPGQGYWSK